MGQMMETLGREDSSDSLALATLVRIFEERSKCRDGPEVGLCLSPKTTIQPARRAGGLRFIAADASGTLLCACLGAKVVLTSAVLTDSSESRTTANFHVSASRSSLICPNHALPPTI